MYAKIENGAIVEYPYTYETLKASMPGTSFPVSMPDERLAEYGLSPVVAKDKPAFNASTEKVVEGLPVLNGNQWEQTFTVVALTAEEIKARVPSAVSMRQARLALLNSGVLAQVNTAMQSAGQAEQIEWEYASEVRRDSPLVISMGAALGLNDEQLDALFISAGGL